MTNSWNSKPSQREERLKRNRVAQIFTNQIALEQEVGLFLQQTEKHKMLTKKWLQMAEQLDGAMKVISK